MSEKEKPFYVIPYKNQLYNTWKFIGYPDNSEESYWFTASTVVRANVEDYLKYTISKIRNHITLTNRARILLKFTTSESWIKRRYITDFTREELKEVLFEAKNSYRIRYNNKVSIYKFGDYIIKSFLDRYNKELNGGNFEWWF